jgi:hypothetical protein
VSDDIERMRETARVVIAERMCHWHADARLQFQYSMKDYTSMTFEEWTAWKRDPAVVSDRLTRIWGRR